MHEQHCTSSQIRTQPHPPHAMVTVSPRTAAVAQKPGKVSTEPGCAADVVCSSVLIVANTTRPCRVSGKSNLAREGEMFHKLRLSYHTVKCSSAECVGQKCEASRDADILHGLDVPRKCTSSSLLLTLLSRSPVLAPTCTEHLRIKERERKSRSGRHD